MAFGTPVAGTTVYKGTGGTFLDVAYPTGIQSTDVVLLFLGQKPSTANVGEATTPTGWTLRQELLAAGGYGETTGVDVGNTNLWVFSWNAPVTGQTGTQQVSFNTISVAWAFMVRIPSDNYVLSYGSATGENTVEPTGSMSIALTDGATATNFQEGDLAIWAMCISTDVTTPNQFSSHSITAAGAVFGAAGELREPDSTLGNDIGGFAAYSLVTNGSGSSTTPPTIETVVAGTRTNVRGPVVLLRIRGNPVIISDTLPVSESWFGNGLVNNKIPTTGGGRWQTTSSKNPARYDVGRVSSEGFGSALFRHSFTLTDATISTTVYTGSAAYSAALYVYARSTPGPTAVITAGYYLYVNYSQITLYKRVAGVDVDSTIISTNVATTGLPLSFSVIGSIITVLLNNVQVIQVTDTSITASGYWGYEVNSTFDESEGTIQSRVGPVTLEIPSVSVSAFTTMMFF